MTEDWNVIKSLVENNAFWAVLGAAMTGLMGAGTQFLLARQRFKDSLKLKDKQAAKESLGKLFEFVDALCLSIAERHRSHLDDSYNFEADVRAFNTACKDLFTGDLKLFLLTRSNVFHGDIEKIRDIADRTAIEADQFEYLLDRGCQLENREHLGFSDELCAEVRGFVSEFAPRLQKWVESEIKRLSP